MKVYDKPLKYLLIHICLGIIASFYSPVLYGYLIYQATQLIINKRFFLFEWRIEQGNSIKHTSVKIVEFFIGFFIGTILHHAK